MDTFWRRIQHCVHGDGKIWLRKQTKIATITQRQIRNTQQCFFLPTLDIKQKQETVSYIAAVGCKFSTCKQEAGDNIISEPDESKHDFSPSRQFSCPYLCVWFWSAAVAFTRCWRCSDFFVVGRRQPMLSNTYYPHLSLTNTLTASGLHHLNTKTKCIHIGDLSTSALNHVV